MRTLYIYVQGNAHCLTINEATFSLPLRSHDGLRDAHALCVDERPIPRERRCRGDDLDGADCDAVRVRPRLRRARTSGETRARAG